jgi:hypothetical protein
MARLYANENFPLPVVKALRTLGHDVLTSSDVGNANEAIPDDEVLRFAINNERAVITHNRLDFIRLHSSNPNHCGILVCTADTDFPALAARIDAQLQLVTSLKGHLIRINRRL